jgi:hypothetical protein
MNESRSETSRVEIFSEVTQSEKPVNERGGYSAGETTVSELPPPPASVSVQDTGSSGSAPATNQASSASSSDSSE